MTVRVLAATVAAAGAIGVADAAAVAPEPVPSLTPAATEELWTRLVEQPRPQASSTAECRPLRAVFYAATDWRRLATRLAANPSPCAHYSISVPPLAADKTQLRAGEAAWIRALGPAFHALAEINVTGWTSWVGSNGGSWYGAGVEARRRMAAAGFDVAAGDTWVVNEFSCGTAGHRQRAREHARVSAGPARWRRWSAHARSGVRDRHLPADLRSLPLPGPVAGLVRGCAVLERREPLRDRLVAGGSTATSATTPLPERAATPAGTH